MLRLLFLFLLGWKPSFPIELSRRYVCVRAWFRRGRDVLLEREELELELRERRVERRRRGCFFERPEE